jgi:DNA-binding CsgD family transcriptional regulator
VATLVENSRLHLSQYLGFTMNWMWMLILFRSPAFSFLLPSGTNAFSDIWFFSLSANALMFLACLIISRRINPLGRFGWLVFGSASVTTLGTVLITSCEYLTSYTQLLLITGAVLTGLGSAVLTLLWGENLGLAKTKQTLMCCIFATIVGSTLCILLDTLIPTQIIRIIIVPFPLIGALLLKKSSQTAKSIPQTRRDKRPPTLLPIRVSMISGFFGLSFGLVFMLAISFPSGDTFADKLLSLGALAFAGVAAFITTMVLKFDFRKLTYQLSLPLMALGFVLITIPSVEMIGPIVHNVGYEYFNIILWTLWAFFGTRDDVAPAWLFACGLFFMQFGQLLGSCFGQILKTSNLALESSSMLSLLAVFGILLMALFFLGNRDFQMGFSLIKPGSDTLPGEKGLRREVMICCTAIGNNHDLTSREIEVMALLAHGFNRPQISAKLFISDETVKTHIKHIYKKLEIHSRYDLVELVENELVYYNI